MTMTANDHPVIGSATPVPRLVLGPRWVSKAVLDGGWWPRSWDAPAELSALVPVLSQRYGHIRSVALSRSSWIGQVRRLAIGDQILRVGWFASVSPALLVATSESGLQCDLLVIPPSSTQGVADRAMARASDPGDFAHAQDLLDEPDPHIPDGWMRPMQTAVSIVGAPAELDD